MRRWHEIGWDQRYRFSDAPASLLATGLRLQARREEGRDPLVLVAVTRRDCMQRSAGRPRSAAVLAA